MRGGGQGAQSPALKTLPQPQLSLLALPKGQDKGVPPIYTAKEEFFNSLLEVAFLQGVFHHIRSAPHPQFAHDIGPVVLDRPETDI